MQTFVRDRPGHYSGVFVSDRVDLVEAADDASYLWLKLKDVVLGRPEVYFCVCYMPKMGFQEGHTYLHMPV